MSNFSKLNFKNFEETLKIRNKYDVIFFMNGHDQFKKNLHKIMKTIKKQGLVVDGRYYFSDDQIKRIEKNFKFLGVGW